MSQFEDDSKLDHGSTTKAYQCLVLLLHLYRVGIQNITESVDILIDLKLAERLGNLSTVPTLERYVIAKDPQVSFLCETRLKKARLDHVKQLLDIEGFLSMDSGQGCIGLALLWNKHVGCVFSSYSKL
ncbi:hypothetical protein V6N13_148874 [Hibiscus sabdariffa]